MNNLFVKMQCIVIQRLYFIGIFLVFSSSFALFAQETYEECLSGAIKLELQKEEDNSQKIVNDAQNICESKKQDSQRSEFKPRIKSGFFIGGGNFFNGKARLQITDLEKDVTFF